MLLDSVDSVEKSEAARLTFTNRLRFKLALTLPRARKKLRLERGILSMTFDDFPRSAWKEGGPVLEVHGARGAYFVCGGLEGTRHDSVEQFTSDDLEALHAAGHEVGAHTFHHISALQTSASKFASSILLNERFLAERLPGYRATSFSYPFGDISLRSIRVVMKYFSCARTIATGSNGTSVSPYLLKAVGLERRRQNEFDIEALIERAARRREWLICYTHDVSDRPSEYGCRPRDLDRVLRLARAAGMDLSPVARVALCLDAEQSIATNVEAKDGLRPLFGP
jgi:peptidoglycan/xylan/chitin deacetylase (PgdA/CDA1 family)